MKNISRLEAARFLSEGDHFAILSHRRPDGDTLGSAAALCLGLRMLGKRAWVLENPEITARFAWLHEGLTRKEAMPEDTLVSVDVASPAMLPETFQPYLGRIALRIDHHASATSFTELEVVDPDSASCAEIVWDILGAMGMETSREVAQAVYVGLSTDTGCFRFANTTAHTFATAAACAQAGVDVYRINQELFETNTLQKLQMQSWIVGNMKLLPGGKALVAIPASVEETIGVTEDDMDNISSFPRSISGVRMAATLRQVRDGAKLSVRAVPGVDATVVAGVFGGGGHKGAAGATLHMGLEDAARAVEEALVRYEI